MGIITEHYAGAFPVWLAPVQVIILPISDKHNDYTNKIKDQISKADIRVEADLRSESIGRKIRDAQLQKIPYMLIVGDKEMKSKKIAVRRSGEGDLGQKTTNDIIKEIVEAK